MKNNVTIKGYVVLFAILLSTLLNAQSVTIIDEAVTWNADQIINTVVTVENGGTLTIEAGVNVDFCWADLNADNIGDLKLVVKEGGTLILNGTADNPVTFQPIVCPVPAGAENNRWGGIVLEGTTNPEDRLKYANIYYARIGFDLSRPVDISCCTFENIGLNPVIVRDFDNGSDVNLGSLTIDSADNSGILVYRDGTNITYCVIDSTTNNGIEIYADDVTVNWCEITGVTGTGIYNSPDAGNTIIQNTLIQDCTGSGIFNLDGTITRIFNCFVTSNDYHGIVNSSGSMWIEQTEVSYNESRGIISAGASYTNANYISTVNNYGYGYQIYPDRLDSDVLVLTGITETNSPEVICRNSNIHDNDTATAYQAYTTAGADPEADFTRNWWGNDCCISDYVYFVNPNSINFTNWILTGSIANTTPLLSKTLAITYPVDNQYITEGQELTVTWGRTGFIPQVKVYVYNLGGVLQSESGIVCNSGSYTFTTTDETYQIVVRSYPDETIVSNIVNVDFAPGIMVTAPDSADIAYGNETTEIKWVSPANTKLAIEYCINGDDADTANWYFKPIDNADSLDATLAKFNWFVPNDSTAYQSARIRIYDVDGLLDTAYSDLFSIRLTAPVQDGGLWYVNKQTGHNMTINVTSDVFAYDTSGAITLSPDEEIYVGAFYVHPTNGPTCAGYQYIRWSDLVENPFLLTVWGDDPTTDGIIEGPVEDDDLIFKIWRAAWSADEPEETIYPVSDFDRTAEARPNSVNYNVNALVSLEYIVYEPTEDNPIPVEDDIVQNIVLRDGWSYISGYVDLGLNNSLSWDTTASNNLLSPPLSVANGGVNMGMAPDPLNFEILKDGDGNVYWVSDKTDLANPVIFANLNTWDELKGYSIMINSSSVSDTLRLVGTQITPQNTPITVNSGWNMIPYLRTNSMSVTSALNNILSNVEIVKDQDGNVYWPAQSINTIGEFTPGESYLLRASDNDPLVYPANTTASKQEISEVKAPVHFVAKQNSDNSAVISISATVTNGLLNEGDEICAIDKYENIVGSAVYTGGNTGFAVWGKSALSDHFGMDEGDEYNIKVWKADTDEVITLKDIKIGQGSSTYAVNAASVITGAANIESVIPVEFELSQNYPNPFNPSTTIRFALPTDSNVKLTIYNMLGEQVEIVMDEFKQAGYHTVKFNASQLATGVYIYQLNAGEFNMVKKMSLIK